MKKKTETELRRAARLAGLSRRARFLASRDWQTFLRLRGALEVAEKEATSDLVRDYFKAVRERLYQNQCDQSSAESRYRAELNSFCDLLGVKP